MASPPPQRILIGHVQGDTGATGATPDFGVGTVTTAAPGATADVTITGTPGNPLFNFTIPRGDAGSAVGMADGLQFRPMTANIHDWIPFGTEGMFAGEGEDITQAPATGVWKYIGVSSDEPTGYQTILAQPEEGGRLLQKTCTDGVWGPWVEYLREATVIPTTVGTDLNTYRTQGFYVQPNVTVALSANILNQPPANRLGMNIPNPTLTGAFTLLVERNAGLVQTYTANGSMRVFKRMSSSNVAAFGPWREFVQFPAVEPAQSGGITGLRSVTTPLVYRCSQNWDTISNWRRCLGAMQLAGFDNNRTWYFIAGNEVVRGQSRTTNDPHMTTADFDRTPIPMNLGTTGYVGNWVRHGGYGFDVTYTDNEPGGEDRNFNDFDCLAFTRTTNTALWIRYKHPGANTLEISELALNGIPSAGTTVAMWATRMHIWLIRGGVLYHCFMGDPAAPAHETWRINRLIGPPTFTAVTDHGLTTPQRVFTAQVYAPARPDNPTGARPAGWYDYVLVWGSPTNRVALWDGFEWKLITMPFSQSNAPNIFTLYSSPPRIGLINPSSNTTYYVCDDPFAATPTWRTLFNVGYGNLMLHRWGQALSFIYRNASLPLVAMEQYPFRQATWEGNWLHPGINIPGQNRPQGTPPGNATQGIWRNFSNFHWPDEILCSLNRSDIVPSSHSQQGYAYVYGSRTSYASVEADLSTMSVLTIFSYSAGGPMQTQGLPPMAASIIPSGSLTLGGSGTSVTQFDVRDSPNRRILSQRMRSAGP